MRSHLSLACASLIAAGALVARPSVAVELPTVLGEPISLDVINTAAGSYHFDNRNDDPRYASRYLDDDYGELIDRLDAQINWWRLQLGTRINGVAYFAKPSGSDAELQQMIARKEVRFDLKAVQKELRTRYLDTIYPAKLWLTYTQPGVEATLGDFYVQLGRGLVFSVRKLDELALDTTVRGGKVVVGHELGDVRLGATAFGGLMNPLRVDDASGRRLHGEGSPVFFGFPDQGSIGDLISNETTADAQGNPRTIKVRQKSRPSYLEDAVLGGRLDASAFGVQLAANAAFLIRQAYPEEYAACLEGMEDTQRTAEGRTEGLCARRFPPVTTSDTHPSFSGSLSIPSIKDHGDLYIEVASQELRGHAVYVAANARGGPIAVSLEGKHYRKFATLAANVDSDPLNASGFGAPEFSAVAYNQPPTAEPIYVEPIGAPNVCVTGGRGTVNYRFNRSTAVYAWLGHYVSFSELKPENTECDTSDENRTNTWDTAAGTEIDYDGGRSHVRAWSGVRQANTEVVYEAFTNAPGDVLYREGYIRYDLVKHLGGSFSLQAQGNHRRRYKAENFANAYLEGENYLALQWSPHLTATFGYEYSSQPGLCQSQEAEGDFCHYFSGGLQWKAASSRELANQIIDTVSLFVGQRRGGLRCVSGVCRNFPQFEGARLELVSKF